MIVSYSEINFKAFENTRLANKRWLMLTLVGAALFAISLLASGIVEHFSGSDKTSISALEFFEVLGLFLAGVCYAQYVMTKSINREYELIDFTKDNHWPLINSLSLNDAPIALLGVGTERTVEHSFVGNALGADFTCFIYCYQNNMDNYKDLSRFVCMSFDLPNDFPLIVAISHSRDHRIHSNDLPKHRHDLIDLKLEGNFNHYYQVQVESGKQTESLEILTPDFMADLIGLDKKEINFEISQNKLYLFVKADFYSEENIQNMLEIANTSLTHLKHLSKTWQMASSNLEKKYLRQSLSNVRKRRMLRPGHVGAVAILAAAFYAVFALTQIVH